MANARRAQANILLRTPLRFQGEQEIALTDGSPLSFTARASASACIARIAIQELTTTPAMGNAENAAGVASHLWRPKDPRSIEAYQLE